MHVQRLMETNIYALKGRVLIVGTCFPEVYPGLFARMLEDVDQVYSLCLETTHINMAVTKLAAVFGTGQLEKLIFLSVDRSPHCTQMHYIMHEIERTLKEHIPIEHYVASDGNLIAVSEEAISLSRNLARLSAMT